MQYSFRFRVELLVSSFDMFNEFKYISVDMTLGSSLYAYKCKC